MLKLSRRVARYKGSTLGAELGFLRASAHHSLLHPLLPLLFNPLIIMPDWNSPLVIGKAASAFLSPPFALAPCIYRSLV